MNVEIPLILLVALIGYFGIKLIRPPLWLIVVLLLVGFLLADTLLAPAIDSGTRTGVDVINGTTK
ncbi:hypothetical protein DMB38_18425 [Streptomyces sp. WAC 06738]|uniref:hypothetical protein n=1 Tax=Streptomyces sp. WAC 06738 TaxID=2203210 RepID=UPI000F6F0CEA|nr:hypothetical protein [Streptomyces sp. WAC 06738]AZM47504.1 hypothetical protein DMB38_18425 [Streptomyces sp. WAC 06738]